ncbi:hypothetical protein QAD02_000912 [Eretmocerus hayati]|uniref:Uncharacterized protein n=1 Tax=Eretmocerus hayati TaxID=131215 RepID=A0ACC2NER4_9HYME|nr:hypothetical protein QAD02_000912 [Eretmocerus hayati]
MDYDNDYIVHNQNLYQMSHSDLEHEIEVFRRESNSLCQQRREIQEEIQKVQEERLRMQRFFKERELCLEIEHESIRDYFRKEEKQLNLKEWSIKKQNKSLIKDDLRSKKDHDELLKLKEQMEDLSNALYQGDIKWSVIIAKQRSQVRVLQVQNSELQQELERLHLENVSKMRKVRDSNTKVFDLIAKAPNENRSGNKLIEENTVTTHAKRLDFAKANCESNFNTHPLEIISDENRGNIKLQPDESHQKVSDIECKPPLDKTIKSVESIERQRNLYDTLLRDAIGDLVEFQVHELEQGIYNYSKSQENLSENESITSTVASAEHNNLNGDVKFGTNNDGVWEVHHPDGCSEYWYPNGNVKKTFPDKNHTKTIYYNGDICETDKHGTVRYFYAETKTWHTTAPDGSEILEFSEFKNGIVKVSFPDGSIKIAKADGSEKWAFHDGTVAVVSINGEKIITLPYGQREVHTRDYKRREYPDGTVKTVYSDGTQETRYPNGRVRKKDKDGKTLMDTDQVLD